jgi:hypothetical protein
MQLRPHARVGVSISLISHRARQGCEGKGGVSAVTNHNARVIRAIKITRILRIARFLKLIRFVTCGPVTPHVLFMPSPSLSAHAVETSPIIISIARIRSNSAHARRAFESSCERAARG